MGCSFPRTPKVDAFPLTLASAVFFSLSTGVACAGYEAQSTVVTLIQHEAQDEV
jgi:hypothetical protein